MGCWVDVQRFESPASSQRIYRIAARVLPHLVGYVHLVLGDHVPTLIDAGSGEGDSSPQILHGLDLVRTRFGESFAPSDIGRLLLTHAHVDHFGGAGELARRWNAAIWMHAFDAPVVTDHDAAAHTFAHRARLFLTSCGVAPELISEIVSAFGFSPQRTPSAEVARLLDDGDLLDGIRVHHTPGHSPGHLCFEVGDFLILGDHILSRTIPQIWPQSLQPMTGLALYRRSLAHITAHLSTAPRPMTGLAGHEDVLTDLPYRLAMLEQNQTRRERRLLGLLTGKAMTIFELTQRLYTTALGSRSLMAIADVAARLEHLLLCGAVCVADMNDRSTALHYTANHQRPSPSP